MKGFYEKKPNNSVTMGIIEKIARNDKTLSSSGSKHESEGRVWKWKEATDDIYPM